jgi:hypothetical protein
MSTKSMPEPLRAVLAEADAAFGREDWARAAGLWSRIPSEFDRRDYSIGDVALNASVARRLACLNEYVDSIRRYHAHRRASTDARPRIALFTSVVGGYDSVKMPEIIDGRFDYILYSETAVSGGGLWDVRPVTASNCSDARAARYVKMHPHRLLFEYDVAIWIDSNVMVVGDLYPLVEEFLQAPEPIGAIQHPHRENIYQEVRECIRQKKDARSPMLEQTTRYRQEGFMHDDLVEANVLMFKLADLRLHAFLDRWWAELESGSRRDQLAFNYALRQVGIDWHRLLERPLSTRTHPTFAYVAHDHGKGVAQVFIDALGEPRHDPYIGGPFLGKPAAPFAESRIGAIRDLKAKVLLFLGSATSSAKECLEALGAARHSIPFEVQIVVDGSTAALNAALAASAADFVVLLEAGVVVARGWLEKMAAALFSTHGAGIVAPLAHCGSESVLHVPAQYRSSSLDALDEQCERASVFGLTPRVPAASGLCLGLRRDVIPRIGLLDHESFPRQAGWDVDYCFRAADAGFDTVIATQTCVAVGARHPRASGDLPNIRAASEALARRHGGRRISRAFMTLKKQPIIERQRDRMGAGTAAGIDIAMPRVLSLQRRRLHV